MNNAVTESREMDELEAQEIFTEDTETVEDTETAEETQDRESTMQKVGYKVELSREYNFNGKKIKEIDLSRLEDLTTRDAEEIDKIMAKLSHYPRNRYRDTLYCKHIAMRATGLPADFFDMLRWKDMDEVTSRVTIYFLLG
jgi:hypothetical protein